MFKYNNQDHAMATGLYAVRNLLGEGDFDPWEVNVDGESGYLFELGDVSGMAKKSIDLLSNEALLNQFKAKAFDLAKRYDIDAVVAQYIDIYHKALA